MLNCLCIGQRRRAAGYRTLGIRLVAAVALAAWLHAPQAVNAGVTCDSRGDTCPDTDGNDCTEAQCDGAGNCDQNGFTCFGVSTCAGGPVPDTDGNVCTEPRCKGPEGIDQNGFTCFGVATCAGGPVPDTDNNVCTEPLCKGTDGIDQNAPAQRGTSCPDTDGKECTVPGCDGAGNCDQIDSCTDTTPPVITCPPDAEVVCGEATDTRATGEATATDDCDPDPDIDHSDNVVPMDGGAHPIQEVIERTLTATDDCGNSDDCVQTITVLKRVLSLDIKPGSCPNPLEPGARGSIPISLLGTTGFDVRTVNVASLLLSRADGVGGTVAPTSSALQDTGTPFGGRLCGCTTRGGDRIVDLSLKFDNAAVVSALQLGGLARGAAVVLVLSGTLSDGCEFIASDCMIRTAIKGR